MTSVRTEPLAQDVMIARREAPFDEDVSRLQPATAPPAMNRLGTLVSNVSESASARGIGLALDSRARHQIRRMIAGQQNTPSAGSSSRVPFVRAPLPSVDRHDARLEPGANGAFLDPILDIGSHPVLDRVPERGMPMHQRDLRAGSKQLQRRFGGGILPTDDDDPLPVIGVRIGVVVRHVRQVFAGHSQVIGQVVVPDRQTTARACRSRVRPDDGLTANTPSSGRSMGRQSS